MSAHGVLYDTFWGKMDEWTRSRPLTDQERANQRLKRDGQEDSLLSLTNAEAAFNALRANPSNVLISAEDAQRIFFLFRGESIAIDKMTPDARAFLQGALMAAVDGSYAMGFIKIVFDSAYMKLPPTTARALAKLVVKVTRKILKHMYRHMAEDDPMDAPLFKVVVGAVSYQCSHYFRTIRLGEPL